MAYRLLSVLQKTSFSSSYRRAVPRDFDDVMGIVGNAGASLDLDYLWSWAERVGLQSELHYVLISEK